MHCAMISHNHAAVVSTTRILAEDSISLNMSMNCRYLVLYMVGRSNLLCLSSELLCVRVEVACTLVPLLPGAHQSTQHM
jgi:hypothetical protein